MSTTTLIRQPGTSQYPTVAAAPARLDVHRLPDLEAWITEHATDRFDPLVLDCSAVEFIDLDTVEAILSAERHPARQLRIHRPSTAMQITFELLGHPITETAIAA
jgi:anti-anti-sigma regulatory factor